MSTNIISALPSSGAVVGWAWGQGGARAAGHNGVEARLFRAQPAHPVLQLRCQVRFLHAWPHPRRCLLKGTRVGFHGPADKTAISSADFTMRSSSIHPLVTSGSSDAFMGSLDWSALGKTSPASCAPARSRCGAGRPAPDGRQHVHPPADRARSSPGTPLPAPPESGSADR